MRSIRRNVKTQNKQLKEATYRPYVRPRSNIIQQYGTHVRKTSHIEQKWFKGQPQGMFKMTITTQAVSQTCSES